MQLSSQLDQLRSAYSECRAVGYADLGAQMVLAISTDVEVPQERWDALCDTGVALLAGEPAHLARNAMGGDSSIAHALVVEIDGLAVFVKSSVHSEDAILCLAEPTLQPAAFIASAGDILARLADEAGAG